MESPFEWIEEFVRTFSAHLATIAFIGAIMWGRNFGVKIIHRLLRWLQRLVTRKPFILIWTDVGFEICVGLANKVQERMPGYTVKPLRAAADIGKYPLHPWATGAIALIVAEVTKFSEDKRRRKVFQERLKRYVGAGGGLFGGHDIIYLRTRNEILQQIFGCQSNSYYRSARAVRYTVTDANSEHPICKQLPADFQLTDEEVTTGEWSDVASVLYSTGGKKKHPLVTARGFGRGRVVWSNSGDSGVYPPKSISAPEDNYVALLCASLGWLAISGNREVSTTEIVSNRNGKKK